MSLFRPNIYQKSGLNKDPAIIQIIGTSLHMEFKQSDTELFQTFYSYTGPTFMYIFMVPSTI